MKNIVIYQDRYVILFSYDTFPLQNTIPLSIFYSAFERTLSRTLCFSKSLPDFISRVTTFSLLYYKINFSHVFLVEVSELQFQDINLSMWIIKI